MAVADPNFNPKHDPTVAQLKQASNALAAIIEALPASRRRSIALTHLETAAMWAVKAAILGDND
ncbi:MAG: hypothetical protein AAF755_10300 [Pseudomonadota bacterium]